MKLTLKASHLDLHLTAQEFKNIENKFRKLGRWLRKYGPAAEMNVELERTTRHHRKGMIYRAEVNLKVPRKLLRKEAFGEHIEVAVEDVYKGMEREIEKYKMSAEEKNYRQARYLKRLKRMTPLAWRGQGREQEQEQETESGS